MSKFFRVSHNSIYAKGFPWIDKILSADERRFDCPECGSSRYVFTGNIHVLLNPRIGRQWPDVMGCGAHPLFIVSSRVIESWKTRKFSGIHVGGRVSLSPPLPLRLQCTQPPDYYWLDGERMLGVSMDLLASGIIVARICHACGRRIEDIAETHRAQRDSTQSYVFVDSTWCGAPLFTSNYSPHKFFCTDAVVDCAREHRHTNFRFVPIELGMASWSNGINYLGKKWPPVYPLRPSEGKTINQWVEDLRIRDRRYKARRALLDLGKDAAAAVPALVDMLQDEDQALRHEAALLLSALGKIGIPLGALGEEAARRHEEWFQKTLGAKKP